MTADKKERCRRRSDVELLSVWLAAFVMVEVVVVLQR